MKPPRVSIIIVNWNAGLVLADCLNSIANTCTLPYEVIVVDNASSDGSVRRIRAAYPSVVVIENKENLGFGRANNQGFEASRGDLVLFLNPDTIVMPGAIERVARFLDENADVGLVGPMLLNSDNSLQASCRNFPTNRNLLLQHLIPRIGPGRWLSDALVLEYWAHNRQRDVDWLIGACLMARRTAFEQVGRFDEEYPHFHEDTDLCYRMRQAGRRVVFLPEVKVIHLGGFSSAKRWGSATILEYYKAKHIFIRKHYGGASLFFHKLLISGLFLMRILALRIGTLIKPDAKAKESMQFLRKALEIQWRK